MSDDLGIIVHRMTKRKNEGCKNSLKNELLQYRDALEVKKRLKDEWRDFLYEQIGLKKSSLFSGIQIYKEFAQLILVPVDGAEGDDAVDVVCGYASIPSSSLKLLLKVAKGVDDAAKEEWISRAAALSYSDFKKLIDEATGKDSHDCGPFEEIQVPAWKCLACGKVHKKVPDSDS